MPFIELQSVDSTNNYAFARIHAGLAQHGDVIFTHDQWAGKGQMGKGWIAEKDTNILLSLIIKPATLPLSGQPDFNFAVACGVHDFFTRYAGSDTRIKWPNDLYWQDRKAGGILIESIVGSQEAVGSKQQAVGSRQSEAEGKRQGAGGREQVKGNSGMVWEWAIVGIGININQTIFDPRLPNPVSLKQITGKEFDTMDLAKEVAGSVKQYLDRVMSGQIREVYEHYLECLYKRNEKVKLRKGTRVFEGIIKSVSPSGQLVVQTSIEEHFDSGMIEWVI